MLGSHKSEDCQWYALRYLFWMTGEMVLCGVSLWENMVPTFLVRAVTDVGQCFSTHALGCPLYLTRANVLKTAVIQITEKAKFLKMFWWFCFLFLLLSRSVGLFCRTMSYSCERGRHKWKREVEYSWCRFTTTVVWHFGEVLSSATAALSC